MARRAARVDANHAEIRDGLRALGVDVEDMSGLGAGRPDLLTWKYGRLVWLECKVPKGGSLTPAQEKWHASAKAKGIPAFVVRSLDEALDVLGIQITRAAGERQRSNGK